MLSAVSITMLVALILPLYLVAGQTLPSQRAVSYAQPADPLPEAHQHDDSIPVTQPLAEPQSGPKAEGSNSQPVVYFGIDDGPSCTDNVTWGMLDLFAEHGALATWFVTGYGVSCDPAALRSIYASGHAIGNHTYNHERLTDLSDSQRLATFDRLQDVVTSSGGPIMTCYRPPYGSTSDSVRASAAKRGMIEWKWNVDPRDWSDPGVNHIINIFNTLEDGDVVVIHDGNSNRQTLDALRSWLPANADKFDFKPLPGCAVATDPVVCQGLPATIVGTKHDDTIHGTPKADVIWAGPGNDVVKGGGGADVICGGGGDDELWGGEGQDTILGGGGNDTMHGGRGRDHLYGGEGNDFIYGSKGDDFLKGGNGADMLWGGMGQDILHGNDGNDTLRGGKHDDVIYGGPSDDLLYGNEGYDNCRGGSGVNTGYLCEETESIF